MTRRGSQVALALGCFALAAALAPGPQASDEAGTLRKLATARAEIGKKIADFYADVRLAPDPNALVSRGIPGADQVEFWTRRAVDARLDASAGREERIAILTQDFERTKAIEARLKALVLGDTAVVMDSIKAEYHRLDAEYRLEKEKAGR